MGMCGCHFNHGPSVDDVTADRNRGMNSEVQWAILSAQVQLNATGLIGQHFSVQNEPKHTEKAMEELFKANILQLPSQSPGLNPVEQAFQLVKHQEGNTVSTYGDCLEVFKPVLIFQIMSVCPISFEPLKMSPYA